MRSYCLALLVASTLSLLACSSESPVAPPPTGSPDIALSPTSIELCYPRCAASTRGIFNIGYVTVTNSGTGVLVWRASSNRSWLTYSRSVSDPTTVKVRVDGTGMARAQGYDGEITFTAVDHADKTAVLNVHMWVVP